MNSPSLLTLGALALALASCGSLKNLNQPLSGSGDFDPLSSPGSSSSGGSTFTSPSYEPGQWVETFSPNAPFFRSFPKDSASADKILDVGTPLKVVSSKGTYLKVQLEGDVGWVPQVYVERPKEVPVTDPVAPLPEFGSVPPPVDPGDLSGEGIAPPPEVPSIPSPVPEVPAVPDLPDAPPVPDIGPPPVPEDLPTVPDVAPPPEVPGITDPVEVD